MNIGSSVSDDVTVPLLLEFVTHLSCNDVVTLLAKLYVDPASIQKNVGAVVSNEEFVLSNEKDVNVGPIDGTPPLETENSALTAN